MPSRRIWTHLSSGLLAIVLALFVWLIANYEQERPSVGRFSTPIPIQVTGLPEDYVITNRPATQVEVEIRAFASSWDTLTANSFVATADLSEVTEGVNIVPVEVICTDRSVTIEAVHQDSVIVQVERLDTAEVEIIVELTESEALPLGYDAMAPSFEPTTAQVSGARSAVQSVASLRGTVSVANQRATFEEAVTIKALDSEGREVQSVKIEPNAVTARVVVEKNENFREVVVRAKTTGVPERGYFVSSVSVSPSTVTVFGPTDVIEDMASVVDTVGEVDTTGATRSFSERLPLALPEGVQVYGASASEPYEVTVSIGIDAVISGITVELPIRIRNIPEGLRTELSVPVVDVLLTGPSAILDTLQTTLLEASVNISALGEGTHQVRPEVRIIAGADSTLQQLNIREVHPEFVQITLTRIETPTASPSPTLAPTITRNPTPVPTRAPGN